MGYRIVVVGATGNVGREMLNILDERQFPIDAIEVLASRRSLGTECMLGDKTMKTKDLDTFDFAGWDEGIMLLRKGEKEEFIIPSNIGYGEAGAGGVMPPNATLVFEVELL